MLAATKNERFKKSIEAKAPATCGELVQGYLNGNPFLINAPIDLYATIQIDTCAGNDICVDSDDNYGKVIQAVNKTLAHLDIDLPPGLKLTIPSPVPRGKGLASSTSEISASIGATARSLGKALTPKEVGDIAIGIESSDGIYYPGVVQYNQLTGELYEELGNPPSLGFLIVDGGGTVSTDSFDREFAKVHAEKHSSDIQKSVDLVKKGFKLGSSRLVAEGATLSARINQGVLYKPLLEPLIEVGRENGALGVNCAHTGTVLGLMFDRTDLNIAKLEERVAAIVGRNRILGSYHMVSGGIQ